MSPADLSISGRRWHDLLDGSRARWPVSIEEWERRAFDVLAAGPRDYIFHGAGRSATRDANVEAFTHWRLVPRMLSTPMQRDLSVTVLGHRYPSPLFLSPVGVLTIAHPDGDVAAALAAAENGATMVVSTTGSAPMEDVAAAVPAGNPWFQLYWVNDRGLTASLVGRAEAAGYRALVLTVDTPMLGWREADLANRYSPFAEGHGIGHFLTDPVFRKLVGFDVDADPRRAGVEVMKLFVNPGLTWADIAWLRGLTPLPILLKGVLHPDDAMRALEVGLDGIVVSNHGGRQVDGSIAALDALVGVREVVPPGVPVLLDGGVRRGSDVVKALALGATAVMVGRPVVYGLAVAGRAGASEVLANLLAETDSVVALVGRAGPHELDTDVLAPGVPGRPR